MNQTISFMITIVLTGLLYSCSQQNGDETIAGRWYTHAQLKMGEQVFNENCAVCHGKTAESISNWKQTLADGSYPPPPLNGSAHAWHHSLSVLLRTINEGGKKLGGNMPGFKNKLTKDEQIASIAFFQSFWDKRIYEIWEANENPSK